MGKNLPSIDPTTQLGQATTTVAKSPSKPVAKAATKPAKAVVKPAAKAAKPLSSISEQARDLISLTFESLLSGNAPWSSTATAPATVRPHIEDVFDSNNLSYRDALVVQFAFWLAVGKPIDLRLRQKGGRGVSKWLGGYLSSKHIRAVKDAFQNIGKNTDQLDRGNLPEFDAVLLWGTDPDRSAAEIEATFRFCCAKIAANARPILPMPTLDRGSLTFGRVSALLSRLYATPSAGAYEQFSIAALLHALVEQQGEASYRVETKNLNASDKSSRSAGDVQILVGNRVVEALEVTANDWTEKLAGAAKTIRDNDLSRLTIIAGGVEAKGDALFGELNKLPFDLSVLEVKSFATSIVSGLTRQGRANALQRLYELLDRYQPKVDVVNQFVAFVEELRLSENPLSSS